jgi:hypothetical protein
MSCFGKSKLKHGTSPINIGFHKAETLVEHKEMFILANQKLHATKLEPRNLPPPKTCQVSVSYMMHVLMIG